MNSSMLVNEMSPMKHRSNFGNRVDTITISPYILGAIAMIISLAFGQSAFGLTLLTQETTYGQIGASFIPGLNTVNINGEIDQIINAEDSDSDTSVDLFTFSVLANETVTFDINTNPDGMTPLPNSPTTGPLADSMLLLYEGIPDDLDADGTTWIWDDDDNGNWDDLIPDFPGLSLWEAAPPGGGDHDSYFRWFFAVDTTVTLAVSSWFLDDEEVFNRENLNPENAALIGGRYELVVTGIMGGAQDPDPIPEPTSLALLGLGLTGVMYRRAGNRRKRS
jgi:hypothetical protein